MRKRIIALLCTVIMAVSLLQVTVNTSTTTKLIPTNIPKSFPVVKMDPGSTQIDFWHAMTGFRAPLVNNLANWFNSTIGKQKKIYVKPIFQGDYDAITIKIQATLQSGNRKDLPDIVQLNGQGAFSVKESKYVQNINDLITADKNFKIKDKLNINQMYACSYKGKQLGLPFSNSMPMLHYNVDAFKAVGLDPNNPPKTYAEYANAAAKLAIKETGKKPVRYGAANAVSSMLVFNAIPRQKINGCVFNMHDGHDGVPTEYTCGRDGSLKAFLTEWKKVLDTGVIDYVTSEPRANFSAGKCAMYQESMVNFDVIDDSDFKGITDKTKIFAHKMARLPTVNPNDSVSQAITGSSIYMFNKGDEKKLQATWEFTKFLAGVDASAYWYVTSGYYPMNNDAFNTKYVKDELRRRPEKQVCIDTLLNSSKDYYFQIPWIPQYGQYNSTISDQVKLMAQGKQTVDQVVKTITTKAESILKSYWNANS